MPAEATLPELLERSARLRPGHVAIEEPPDEAITYGDLDSLSDRLRDRLCHLGVGPGDRVGIYLGKSIDAAAAIWGVLKTGAAYVPVDPAAPAWRSAYVLHDCSVRTVVLEDRLAQGLSAEMDKLGETPPLLLLEGAGGGRALLAALERESRQGPAGRTETVVPAPDDLAYILYTSGSTGRPKGVMLSHRNAVSFIDWCSEAFAPEGTDRFSSHAPFHFDLSILDLFLPAKHGATVVLIGDVGKEPLGLAALVAERRISMWYSTPSILTLLAQYGKLERHDCSSLRMILFAGEVFPVKHLRALKALLPRPRYFNLYGPTETNVCTYYEIPTHVPPERTEPYPIGKACSHLRTRVIDEHGEEVLPGGEGELCVSGPAVMRGYWNLPEQSAQVFLRDTSGLAWYRTGDIVVEAADGNYVFVGRRDRMVKRRGYRIELGEIEAGFYRHPAIREAAVAAVPDGESGILIRAWLSCREGERPSLIELKRFCAENLPLFMVPDRFAFLDVLPKTSTDKIDYQRLTETG
jgi:amino acid adenylation domain-containing protein